jgi:V/A-type H+-transporting ATPase subunit E
MTIELKNLIDKIKKDGVEQAENEAATIIAEAKVQAKGVIDEAHKKAREIIVEAEEEAGRFKVSSEQAFKQAARDALLALRGRVTEFFARIVKTNVQDELSSTVLKDIILQAVEHCIKEGVMDIEVIVSNADKKALEKKLFTALRKEAKEKILLRASNGIEKGFRIGARDKNSYLDFTDQAIVEGFRRYLNPKLIDALDIDLGLNQEEKNAK